TGGANDLAGKGQACRAQAGDRRRDIGGGTEQRHSARRVARVALELERRVTVARGLRRERHVHRAAHANGQRGETGVASDAVVAGVHAAQGSTGDHERGGTAVGQGDHVGRGGPDVLVERQARRGQRRQTGRFLRRGGAGAGGYRPAEDAVGVFIDGELRRSPHGQADGQAAR